MRNVVALKLAQIAQQVAEYLLAAYVENDGNVSKVGADGAQLSEFRDKARGQIVDAKIAQVFQTFGGLALAGA